jgi:hypothetical protein
MIHKIKKWVWKENHPRIKDPVKKLYVYVGLMLFCTLMVLIFSMVYIKVEPGTDAGTALVIYEYPSVSDITIDNHIGEFAQSVKQSPEHSNIMLAFYTFWIIIVGLTAATVSDYRRRKKQE